MEVPEGCESCPRLNFYLGDLEIAEAGKQKVLADSHLTIAELAIGGSADNAAKLLNILEDLSDSETPAFDLRKLLHEDMDSSHLGFKERKATKSTETALDFIQERIAVDHTCLGILTANCAGVRKARRLFGGSALKCSSAEIKSALGYYEAWTETL